MIVSTLVGSVLILIGCVYACMGILVVIAAQKVVLPARTSRRLSRSEVRFFMSSMALIGSSHVCLAVTAFRPRFQDVGSVASQLNAILAPVLSCIGFSLYTLWLVISRQRDKQFGAAR